MPKKGERSEKRRKKYEELQKTLNNTGIRRWEKLSEQEREGLQNIKDLVTRMAEYTDPEKPRRITREEMEDLVKEYQKTLSSMEKMESFHDRDDFKKLRRIMGKDMKVFYDALSQKKDQQEFDIVDLYDASRSLLVEVDEKTIEKTGGNISQRLHIQTKDENGNDIDGYFTVHEEPFVYDEQMEKLTGSLVTDGQMDKEFVRYLVEYEFEEQGQTELCKLRTKYTKNTDKTGEIAATYRSHAAYRKGIRKTIGADIKNYAALKGYAQGSKEYAALEHTADMLTKDTAATDKLLDAVYSGFQISNKRNVYEGYGIEPGARVDMRNTAMTTCAQVLGLEKSIAPSRSMRVKIGEKTYKGTFMDTAKGYDLKKVEPGADILDVAPADLQHNVKLIKSVANLQILDFLCGNVDRHSGNLSYITKKVKNEDGEEITVLDDVQGFDNDTSFLAYHGGLREANMSAVPFSNMLIIPKETAEIIVNTDPVLLAGLLTGNDLTPKELSNTVKRIESAQKEIRRGMEYSEAHPDALLSTRRIKVVTDEQIAKLNFYEDLCNYQKYGLKEPEGGAINLFARVYKEFTYTPMDERLLSDYLRDIMIGTDTLVHEAKQIEENLTTDAGAMAELAAQDKNDQAFSELCKSMQSGLNMIARTSHKMVVPSNGDWGINSSLKSLRKNADDLAAKSDAFAKEQQKKVDSLAEDAPGRELEIKKLNAVKAFSEKAQALKQQYEKVAGYQPKLKKYRDSKAARIRACEKKLKAKYTKENPKAAAQKEKKNPKEAPGKDADKEAKAKLMKRKMLEKVRAEEKAVSEKAEVLRKALSKGVDQYVETLEQFKNTQGKDKDQVSVEAKALKRHMNLVVTGKRTHESVCKMFAEYKAKYYADLGREAETAGQGLVSEKPVEAGYPDMGPVKYDKNAVAYVAKKVALLKNEEKEKKLQRAEKLFAEIESDEAKRKKHLDDAVKKSGRKAEFQQGEDCLKANFPQKIIVEMDAESGQIEVRISPMLTAEWDAAKRNFDKTVSKDRETCRENQNILMTTEKPAEAAKAFAKLIVYSEHADDLTVDMFKNANDPQMARRQNAIKTGQRELLELPDLEFYLEDVIQQTKDNPQLRQDKLGSVEKARAGWKSYQYEMTTLRKQVTNNRDALITGDQDNLSIDQIQELCRQKAEEMPEINNLKLDRNMRDAANKVALCFVAGKGAKRMFFGKGTDWKNEDQKNMRPLQAQNDGTYRLSEVNIAIRQMRDNLLQDEIFLRTLKNGGNLSDLYDQYKKNVRDSINEKIREQEAKQKDKSKSQQPVKGDIEISQKDVEYMKKTIAELDTLYKSGGKFRSDYMKNLVASMNSFVSEAEEGKKIGDKVVMKKATVEAVRDKALTYYNKRQGTFFNPVTDRGKARLEVVENLVRKTDKMAQAPAAQKEKAKAK